MVSTIRKTIEIHLVLIDLYHTKFLATRLSLNSFKTKSTTMGWNQTGNTTAIRCIAVREAGVSQQNGEPVRAPPSNPPVW